MDQKIQCRPRIQRFALDKTNSIERFRLSAALVEATQRQEKQIEARLTPEQKLKRDQDMAARSQRMWERLQPVLEKFKR
jgi:hypothetical protein